MSSSDARSEARSKLRILHVLIGRSEPVTDQIIARHRHRWQVEVLDLSRSAPISQAEVDALIERLPDYDRVFYW